MGYDGNSVFTSSLFATTYRNRRPRRRGITHNAPTSKISDEGSGTDAASAMFMLSPKLFAKCRKSRNATLPSPSKSPADQSPITFDGSKLLASVRKSLNATLPSRSASPSKAAVTFTASPEYVTASPRSGPPVVPANGMKLPQDMAVVRRNDGYGLVWPGFLDRQLQSTANFR